MTKTDILIILLAGILRHTAGFTWAYNQKLYFEGKLENDNFMYYLMLCPVISGVIGTTFGGALTDYLRRGDKFSGIQGALLVLSLCHMIAAPLMVLVLTLDDPYCFILLFITVLFSEMWFGVYIVAVSELFQPQKRGSAIAYTIFILRIVAGNVPGLIVPYIRPILGYYWTLMLLVPGLYALSSVIWGIMLIRIKISAY